MNVYVIEHFQVAGLILVPLYGLKTPSCQNLLPPQPPASVHDQSEA